MKILIDKPFINLYIARVNRNLSIDTVFNSKMKQEILSVNDKTLKAQKITAYNTLKKAVMHSFNIDIESETLQKLRGGKWVNSKFYFSITHKGEYVLVAVSNFNVGIDIEELDERFNERVFNKISTESEKNTYKNLTELQIASLFTKKESLFKTLNESEQEKGFIPNKIDTTKSNFHTYKILNNIILSVCAKDTDSIKFYRVENNTAKIKKFSNYLLF